MTSLATVYESNTRLRQHCTCRPRNNQQLTRSLSCTWRKNRGHFAAGHRSIIICRYYVKTSLPASWCKHPGGICLIRMALALSFISAVRRRGDGMGPCRATKTSLVWFGATILALEENLFRMNDWMKFICKIFLGIGVNFRDESNDVN